MGTIVDFSNGAIFPFFLLNPFWHVSVINQAKERE